MDSPLVIALICLVILSGYFSGTETAFSTSNKIRLKNWATGGNKKAGLVLHILDDYDKFITNVLIGNNIVNILATTIATILFAKVWADPSMSATMTTVIMTLVVLTFGEILPKTLGKNFPEKFAMFSAPIIRVLGYLFYPLSFLFLLLQRLTKKMLKAPKDSVTNEELITIIKEAESTGGIDKENGELLRSAVEFDDVLVSQILTPRVDIVAITKNEVMENIFQTFKKSGFSRLPVYDVTIDNIIGFIHEKDFFFSMHYKKENILDIIQPVVFTQTQVKVDDLLKKMQKNATHMSVVLDEFGGTAGIVTLEDCIEELVGEIYDETDDVEEMFQEVKAGEYLVFGNANLSDFFEFFKVKLALNEEYDSNTVGGWVCEFLEVFPSKGLSFEFKKLKIEVLEISRHRIKRIKVNN